MSDYPICSSCGRRITVHVLRGHLAYCDEIGGNRASFTIRQVNDMHRVLGHPLSDNALDLERREALEV